MAGSKKFPGARLDLTAQAPEEASSLSAGVSEAPISQFEEDPGNPRQDYAGAKFDRFVASVRRRGVLVPVTVHPQPSGKLRLVTGHRRFRAAALVGLTHLTYAIAGEHQRDVYAQFEENGMRDDIEPLDKAQKIHTLIDAGASRKDIAAELGMDGSAITHLLGLLDLPPFLQTIYDRGECRQPKYLYDLRKLHEKQPTLVERRCASSESISHSFMENLVDAVNAIGTSRMPERQELKGMVEQGDRNSATPAVSNPPMTRQLSYQGRAAKILKIVAQFEDGTECDLEGDALDRCVWAAAEDS